jgi:hypothetical protein
VAIGLVACSSSGGGSGPADDAAPDTTDPGDTFVDDVGPEVSPPDAAPGEGGEAGVDADASDGSTVLADLQVKSAKLQNVGRSGTYLRVEVQGHDPRKQTTSAVLRFLDADGAEIAILDSDWNGEPDTAKKRFRFMEPSTLGQVDFTGTLLLPGLYAPKSKVAQVEVTLEDELGNHSAPLTTSLALQPERALGEGCDPKELADRCAPHLSCGGTPTVCQPGVAPQLTKTVYYGGAAPRMLFLGSEPDQDIKHVLIEFYDAAGNPKSVDLLNDGNPSTGFTSSARQRIADSTFYVAIEPVLGFDTTVPKIVATPVDTNLNKGTPVPTTAVPVPVRALNESCDWLEFDVCASGNVCSPGTAAGPNTCQAATPLRKVACNNAPLLEPDKGTTKAFGITKGPSLWDVPTGCEPHNAVGRPESVVTLRLAKAASQVTISTAMPETDFDTVVYLLPGCAGVSSAALGCNDDARGSASVLTVKNVPAGDYLIVVDSILRDGGRFGLSVDVK